ncbi:MAG: NPCBM/NEW2 domain-containing protein [Planctomycetota bacterium]
MDSFELADGALTGKSGKMQYLINSGAVRRLRVRSDAYRYLSDLQPAHVSSRPFVDVVWPPRLDRAVSGGPLTLGGKTYPKGIGMHVRTEMTFALGGAYSQFHAVVGVDDSAGQLGQVVFRVQADGEVIYESDPMSGGDAPQVLALDVMAAQMLTVAADFGDPLIGSGNFADWADARVVR